MKRNYDIFLGQEDLIDNVIEFFTSPAVNPEKFEEIRTVCLEWDKRMRQGRGETMINMGHLSAFDFIGYMTTTKQVGNGIKTKLVDLLLELLDDELVVLKSDEILSVTDGKRYKVNGDRAKYLHERGLIKNLIFGFNYIIQKYSSSVFKIENIKKVSGEEIVSIGTGFLMRYKKQIGEVIATVITNKHVVENCKAVRILDGNDTLLLYSKILSDPNRDLAVIELKNDLDLFSFHLYPQVKELSEVITIGYPKIPLSRYAYQVYHKGEINSHIEDYFGNKLFLLSAITSPGNSGGPIIDRSGLVVGIVTEMLFEQESFFQKGILPYSAGIPGIEILDFLNSQYLS